MVAIFITVIGVVGAFIDFRQHRLPNSLIVAILMLAVLTLWLAPMALPSSGWLQSLSGLAVTTLVLLPGWMMGALGAGDVKLASVLAFSSGLILVPLLMVGFALLLGAWCAIAWLLGYRDRQPATPALVASYILVLSMSGLF